MTKPLITPQVDDTVVDGTSHGSIVGWMERGRHGYVVRWDDNECSVYTAQELVARTNCPNRINVWVVQ